MILAALLLAQAKPSPPLPRFNGPAKMIILNGASGAAVTDYPSLERCQQARAYMVQIVRRGEPSTEGDRVMRVGLSIYCVPG